MSKILSKLKDRIAQVSNSVLVPNEIKIARLDICEKCEYLVKSTRQCSKCFCFVDGKTAVKNSKCPKGKW